MGHSPTPRTGDKDKTDKDELADNAEDNGVEAEDEAVEDYAEQEDSYSRDPDEVRDQTEKKS